MILYNSYATWKAIEGGIMSNRHMATKRAHNKIKPDVRWRRKAAATQLPPDNLTIEISPGMTLGMSPALSQEFLEKSAELVTSFESPESSNIHSARYDSATEQLWVVFRREVDGGECPTYLYTGFPPAMWVEFVQASSKGRYVAQRIKPMFAGKRV